MDKPICIVACEIQLFSKEKKNLGRKNITIKKVCHKKLLKNGGFDVRICASAYLRIRG